MPNVDKSSFSRLDPALALLRPPETAGENLEDAMFYYLDHPVQWVEDTIGIKLYSWQEQVLDAIPANHFVSVRSGHGVGKSAMIANAALWFLCTHPFSKVICTAPTKEQLYDVLWSEFAQWIRRSSQLNALVEWSKDRIVMKSHPEEWFIAARTAEVRRMAKDGFSVSEGLQGRHAESILFIIDEASGIDEAIISTVYGALTTEDAYVIMTGNPTRVSGTFYDSHHSKRDLWKTFHVNCEEQYHIPRKWVSQMLAIYGSREHPLYRIRVRGEFPTAAHNSIYPLELLEAAKHYDNKATRYDIVEMAVDVARYGGDFTAIAVKHGPEITHLSKYPHLSTMETAGKVIRFIQEFNPCVVRIDAVGVGGGVLDRLREQGYKQCIPFNGGASPSENRKKEFMNLRAESHWHLRELLEQARLKLPNDCEELIAQMSGITYEVTSTGKIKVESKEDMRSRGQKSPDMLDAIVMACYPSMPTVKKTGFGIMPIFGR